MMARFMLAGAVLVAAPGMAQQRPKQVVPAVAAPAVPPSVRAGVDLWRAGDYPGAVAIWQPFANAGDADAMFNIGQAYKLGRALPLDKAIARDWYRRAAAKGHMPAQANLGILLFQAGEKPEAARWLKMAADRGEMRAQYVLGVAHWNGDGVVRSLPLAYAYLSRASGQGLTEATGALGNLSRMITPAERTSGQSVATSLAAGNGVPATVVASAAPTSTAELNRMNMEAVQKPAPAPKPAMASAVAVPIAPVAEKPKVVAPPPVVVAVVPKPVAAVAAAVVPPRPVVPKPVVPPVVTGPPAVIAVAPTVAPATERPAAPAVRVVELPASAPPAPAPKPLVVKAVQKLQPVDKPKVAEKPKVVEPEPGWRVQLGAFGKKSQAEAAWAEVVAKQKAAVGKAKPIYAPGTSIIKLQMGPYKTRDLAKDACAKIAFSGRACFVTEG